MKFRTLCLAVVVTAVACPIVPAQDILRLIEQGKLDQARQELSKVSTAARRDGNHLFYQALLEPDGARSAELLEVALNSSVDFEHREFVNYRLAQYYFFSGNWDKLERVIVAYRAKFESGRYANEMARFSLLLDERAGNFDEALQQADRQQVNVSADEARQWGQIDRARILLSNKKGVGADKLLQKLSREKSGPGVPVALYMLAVNAMNARRADDAVYYYNVLRDTYPGAIGQDALVDRMAEVSEKEESRGAEAEQITGTYYSIQIGVFSEAANAKKLADRLKAAGYRVDIVEKTISRTNYRVVYVGRYRTWAEADAAKARLEAEQKESYQVIAR